MVILHLSLYEIVYIGSVLIQSWVMLYYLYTLNKNRRSYKHAPAALVASIIFAPIVLLLEFVSLILYWKNKNDYEIKK